MILRIITAVFLLSASLPSWADPIKNAHVELELISSVEHSSPNSSFWLGLVVKPEKDWHTYWKNPGDSGITTTISWELPEGFSVSQIFWPYPQVLDYGELTSYGYKRDVVLLTKIDVSDKVVADSLQAIKMNVKFLACKEICVPGKAELTTQVSIQAGNDAGINKNELVFDQALRELPKKSGNWKIKSFISEGYFHFFIQSVNPLVKEIKGLRFFPFDGQLIDHHANQKLLALKKGNYELVVKKALNKDGPFDKAEGVVVFSTINHGLSGNEAIEISLPVQSAQSEKIGAIRNEITRKQGQRGSINVIMACLLAFVGGLILNLMPCVLPVLSIKVLGLIGHSEKKSGAYKRGLMYGLGILVSFWLLAGLLIGLRVSGESIGWGFQFQSPVFIVFIATLLYLVALNLFGLFEVGASLTGIGSVNKKKGYGGAFVSGMLTTVIATPCTAPFMGTAIGFALAQPLGTAFLIFTFLGIGLSFPYIMLTVFPSLLKFVPKPGVWMNYLRVFLGFLMLLSVLWLVGVLQKQADSISVLMLLGEFLVIWLLMWLYGESQKKGEKTKLLRAWIVVLAVGSFIACSLNIKSADTMPNELAISKKGINWVDFSPALVEDYRKQGRAVFIDFTASWCLSCQVNDRLVFKNQKVIDKFNDLDIVPIKADWTNRDEDVTKALEEFGKNSIPLYVMYGPDAKEPVILPEIITPKIVLNALNSIEQRSVK